MKKIFSIICVLSSVVLISGCATILSGSTQKINVTTESGKKTIVSVDGQRFEAPTIIELRRENRDKILRSEECPEQQVLLNKEINPVFFVNILSGGVFGSTTDYVSASMWKYEPENINIKCPSKEVK